MAWASAAGGLCWGGKVWWGITRLLALSSFVPLSADHVLWALPRGAHRGVRPVHRGEYRSLHDGALRPSAKRDLSPPDPGGKGLNKRGPKGFASSPCHSHPFPSSTPHLSAHAFATKLPDSPSSGQPSLTQGPRCSCEPSALSAPGRVAWACPGPGLGFIHLIPSVAHDWASWTQAPGRDTEKPLRSTLGQSWFQLQDRKSTRLNSSH